MRVSGHTESGVVYITNLRTPTVPMLITADQVAAPIAATKETRQGHAGSS